MNARAQGDARMARAPLAIALGLLGASFAANMGLARPAMSYVAKAGDIRLDPGGRKFYAGAANDDRGGIQAAYQIDYLHLSREGY